MAHHTLTCLTIDRLEKRAGLERVLELVLDVDRNHRVEQLLVVSDARLIGLLPLPDHLAHVDLDPAVLGAVHHEAVANQLLQLDLCK